MLCSCTKTSLDVKVAYEQTWGKQEGFDRFCGEEALEELWLVQDGPKTLVLVDQCLWRVMLKQSWFGETSLCGQELLPKGKIQNWFSALPREASGFGAMFG